MIIKRRSNFFDVYIVKLLKNISEKAEISRDTRNQLNMIIQIYISFIKKDLIFLIRKIIKPRSIIKALSNFLVRNVKIATDLVVSPLLP